MRLAVQAYQRRRGWLAWHVAMLGRAEFTDGFPALEVLTGEVGATNVSGQSDEIMAHNLRLWRSVLLEAHPDTGCQGDASA